MTLTSTISLTDGGQLPLVGLGMWKIPKPICPQVVRDALEMGYRHLDCACDYGNEPEVGQGIAQALAEGIVKREDIWVTSKLWNTYHRPEYVRPALERTLADLQLQQLDLYHVHFPISLAYVPFETRYPPEWFFDPDADQPAMKPDPVPIRETWAAMEELVEAGLVKRIGVCNFGTSLLRDLLSQCKIRPSVLQIELHPYLAQNTLVQYAHSESIAVTAFSPLGAKSYQSIGMAESHESVLEDEVVTSIAGEHGRSAAQIVLRWGIQRGTAVIPKSQQADHLRDNLSALEFELTEKQMAAIDALDRHRRFNDPADFGQKAFNTFYPIFD